MTNNNLIPIPGRLHDVSTNGVVSGADEIFDDAKGKRQSVINQETDAALDNKYDKDETYSKQELNNLITTPNQDYVTVPTYASLPATGEADTVYRVSNYDGEQSQVDATKYSEYAWDGTQYVFLCVKSQIGEVFDITAYNSNTKYADLTAALGTGGENIPEGLRKGGMTVKFVQSSDNKYVQARCMAQNFTTDVTQWQGTDDEPIAGSNNLITSDGVYNNIVRPEDSFSSEDLKLCDENDSILVEFKNGGIKTKNFNSEEIIEELSNMPCTDSSTGDLDIADEDGNIIARYHDGIHETKYPAPYTKENPLSDFDFSDKDGNIVLRVQNGYPKTRNFDGSELSPNTLQQVKSSIGEGQMRVSYPSIASDATIELTDFPRNIDTRKFFSFIGYMDTFPSSAHFDFGIRYKYNGQYWHNGCWIRVTTTNVEIYFDQTEGQSTLEQSYTHGLTLSTFVKIFFYLREDYSLFIILETLDGKYVIEHSRDNADSLEIKGYPILINGGISFTDAQITAGSADFKSPIWIFGDSYCNSRYYSRAGRHLMDLGLSQNICFNHIGGQSHSDAWSDLQLMMAFGTPRLIVWLLGVNGNQETNVAVTDTLNEFCDKRGIELILEYPPLYPNSINIDTTNLRNKVLETGRRIVNYSRAVGCHVVEGDAVWYDEYLENDKVHPSEKATRAIVMQIINDVPEILQWGVNEHPVYYSSNNN